VGCMLTVAFRVCQAWLWGEDGGSRLPGAMLKTVAYGVNLAGKQRWGAMLRPLPSVCVRLGYRVKTAGAAAGAMLRLLPMVPGFEHRRPTRARLAGIRTPQEAARTIASRCAISRIVSSGAEFPGLALTVLSGEVKRKMR